MAKNTEVEELVYGYSTEKMAMKALKSQWGHLFINNEFPKAPYPSYFQVAIERWIEGFNVHKELVKDKLFTIEDMEVVLDIIDSENSGLSHQDRLNEISEHITKLLQPKTEWRVTFDEQGKLKLV